MTPRSNTRTEQVASDGARAESVGELLSSLLPELTDNAILPNWPPDVFCLMAALLHRSGAYTRIVGRPRPQPRPPKGLTWEAYVEQLGGAWRRAFGQATLSVPRRLQESWAALQRLWSLPIGDLGLRRAALGEVILLLACADEACAGIGLSVSSPVSQMGPVDFPRDRLLWDAEERLILTIPDGSSMCKRIHPSRGRVLPKMHTPQTGLTIRSISHHACYCPASEMKPQWYSFATGTQEHSLNLLLIPWPPLLTPVQFGHSRKVGLSDLVRRGGYGLFTYHACRGPAVSRIRELVRMARKSVGRVDGVVLPEAAVSPREQTAISKAVVGEETFLISGVAESARGGECGRNYVAVDMFLPGYDLKVKLQQAKHHRWKLTKSQIVQYGIGTNLHPEANWWEHIAVNERTVMFVSLRPWLTLTALICEDLARPDPVGDLVRAVGPHLIVALLMDGPQLNARWPARYAASLADDPGCSVLTVTSAGMSGLSRPNGGENRNRIVALWKDARRGVAQELELPAGADALLLNLTVEYAEEWSADGRGDGGVSSYPILAGYHPIYLEKRRRSHKISL